MPLSYMNNFFILATFDEFDKVRVSESRYKEFMKFITDFLKSDDDAAIIRCLCILKLLKLLSEGKES